ncbi:HD domain-containing protein [Candidatus Marsarchaeota archaeon]|nr:HD domain-containing protein [Candidatus Marsarchaeota archaeon]
MNKTLKNRLITIAKKNIKNDISHDFSHAYRVLQLSEKIGNIENADMDILIPAALFHDIKVYKGTSKYIYEHEESSNFAEKILNSIKKYPKHKIKHVGYAISVCSFSKNINPKTLEAKILQDADLLEASGAIGMMRTFGSTNAMHRNYFYNMDDPFCKVREPDENIFVLDLFFTRLLIVQNRMHTKTAIHMAKRRYKFLKSFINELHLELKNR